MKAPQKIAIVGPPGSGKSTLAAQLSKQLGLPVYHLDKYMFVAGDKKRDKLEFISIQKKLVQEPAWIIEGCSSSTFDLRFAQADQVIYLHPPRLLCIWRALKRRYFPDHSLEDMAEGCSKVFNWEMVRYIWGFDKHKGAMVRKAVAQYPKVEWLMGRDASTLQK